MNLVFLAFKSFCNQLISSITVFDHCTSVQFVERGQPVKEYIEDGDLIVSKIVYFYKWKYNISKVSRDNCHSKEVVSSDNDNEF